MALSGVITNNFATYYYLQLEWVGSQNIANNTTTITAKLYIGGQGNIISSADKTAKIIIDGVTYTSTTARIAKASGEKKLIYTATRTINHNADGTRKVSLGGSCWLNATLSGTYYGTVYLSTTTFSLDTIPRASTISSFPNFTIGNDFTINISRASTSFTHDVTLKVGNTIVKTATGIGTSYTFSLTEPEQDKIYAAIPTATAATMTLVCQTKSGSNNIGSAVSKTAMAYVPSSIVPTFDTITHNEHMSSVNTIVGKYVQGLSRLNLAITGAAGAKYSTIKSCQITLEGVNYNASLATSELIRGSGDITIAGKVTDSRGRTATKAVTVDVLPYTPPKITAFTLQRCNSDGTSNTMGEYVRTTRAGSVSSLINVTEKNTLIYRIKSKTRGAVDWTTKKSTTISGLSLTGSDVLGEYAAVTSYDFRLEIADKFNTTLALNVLPTGKVTMSWDKEGVGIGKVREQGALDVGGDVYVDGNIYAGGSKFSGGIPSGVIVMWSGLLLNIPPGWALCDGNNGTPNLLDRFILGVGSGEEPGTTGGSHTKILTVANLPPHAHAFTTGTESRSHTHSVTGGNHSHTYQRYKDSGSVSSIWGTYPSTLMTFNTGGTGAHSHTVGNASQTHTHSGTTSTTGSGTAFDARPKYFKLAFIMKL